MITLPHRRTNPQHLLSLSASRSPLTGLALILSLGFNITALIVPFMVLDTAFGSPTDYTMFAGVKLLWKSGLQALAVLVIAFSVVFPFAKLTALAWVWAFGQARPQAALRLLRLVEPLGKWSMLDIFLVCLMLALTNDQWAVSTHPRSGVACFLAAITLSMLCGSHLSRKHGLTQETRLRPITGGLTLLGVGLLAFLPIVRINSFWLRDDSMTFLDTMRNLAGAGAWSLAVAVGVFLLLAPAAAGVSHLWGTWLRLIQRDSTVWARRAAGCEHWGMLDVFTLALLIFLIEGRSMVPTEVQPGAWILVACVGAQIIGRLWPAASKE